MDNKERCRQYYEENREELKLAAATRRLKVADEVSKGLRKAPDIKEKYCKYCDKTLPIENFSFRKSRNLYENKCKNCRSAEAKQYRKDNSEKISKQRTETHAVRVQEDQLYAVTRTLRNRFNKLLDSKSKTTSKSKLIGESKKFLIKWLDFNLKLDDNEMSWSNRGTIWHIDHVIPCDKFNLIEESEQRVCMHWSNLKPVLARKNISKGNKVLLMQCIEHEMRLKLFAKKHKMEINNTLFNWVNNSGVLSTAVMQKCVMQQ